MCSISDIPIVGEALSRISEITVDAAFRQIGYIFCYKAKVEALKSEIDGLNIKEKEIETRVEEATNNAKNIKEHVLQWQAGVKEIKNQVTEFLGKNEGRTSWRCFNVLSCPNPYRRWKLGRWAVKQTAAVTMLADLDKKQVKDNIADFPAVEPTHISRTGGYQEFGSRDAAYKKILEALTRVEEGFPVVAIHGFGGVGKTRMMEQVSKQVKDEGIFKTVARANVGQVVDVDKIQDQLALHLNVTETHRDKAFQLNKRLSNGEKILVILDDLWEEINFEEIGIPFGDASIKGCKILITSRLQGVCYDNKCKDPVEVEALTANEAWGMFSEAVGISLIDVVGEDLARKVCDKCARLPLIIFAVGKALRKMKDKYSWEDALNQLRHCTPEKIAGVTAEAYACLRLSFNVLNEDAYLLLLLCSLYGEDEEIEIESLFRLAIGSGLLKGWDTFEAARNRVNAMVSELKSSSLLLEGRYDRVKLHDIIRDVAISITAKEKEYAFFSATCDSMWPRVDLSCQKLIKLDFKSENVNFPDDLVCPHLHTLFLDCSNMSGEQLPDSFFKAFPQLKCLSLKIKSLSTIPSSLLKCDTLRNLTIHLLEETEYVNGIAEIIQFKNLEMLALHMPGFRGLLPDLRHLRRLRMLDLRHLRRLRMLDLRHLRRLRMLDLRHLRRLRMLDLNKCKDIEIRRDEICGLLNLEELYLPFTKGRMLLSPSDVNKLTQLTSLEIHFPSPNSCPDENFCRNLGRYSISLGWETQENWWYDEVLERRVKVKDSCVTGGVKILVERAHQVILQDCTGIEFQLGSIPMSSQPVGSFSNLQVLRIERSSIKYVFSTLIAKCLQQLKKLDLRECEMMEEIVRYDQGTDYGFLCFPKLTFLRLENLPELKGFCDKSRNMLPSTSTEQTNEASQVHSLFDGMILFPALGEIYLSGIKKIEKIWEDEVNVQDSSFCQLRGLTVKKCPKLKNVIPYSMCRSLQNLYNLIVNECEMMEEIVRYDQGTDYGFLCFPKLTFLRLENLPELKGFCDKSRNMLPSTSTEQTNEASQVHSLFDGMILFPALEQINLEGIKKIEKIWEDEVNVQDSSFCQLRRLYVDKCPKLKNVIPYSMCRSLQNLYELKKIEVENCLMVNEIIASVGEEMVSDHGDNIRLAAGICEEVLFPQLLTVKLRRLPDLKHFSSSPHYCLKMPLVERFEVLECSQLVSFTPGEIISSPVVDIRITYPSCGEHGTAVFKDSLGNINKYLQQPHNTQGTRWFDEYKKLNPEAELKDE